MDSDQRPAAPRTWQRQIAPVLRGLAAILLVTLVVAFALRGIDFPTAQQWKWIASSENLLPSAVLGLCVMVSVLLRGVRWSVLLSTGAPIERSRLVTGFAWCFLVLQTIPFRAGEPYRVLWVKLRGGSATQAATSAVLDRLIDAVAICLVLVIAVLSQPAFIALVGWKTPVLVLAAAMLALVGAIFVAPVLLGRLVQRLSRGRLSSLLDKGLAGITAVLAHGRWIVVLLLTVATWSVMAVGFIYYLSSTVSVSWATAIGVLALVNLSGVLALTPANMGVFEAVTVAALAAVGVAPGIALVTAIGLHLAILGGQALTGLGSRLILLAKERQ